jgi:undecaprenyl-diphosphatase
VLWFGVAAGLAVLGGRRSRRAAMIGVAAIGVTSAVVNLAVKPAVARQRPEAARVASPRVRMPSSTSFPSGHSASAFAFASAIGGELPLLAAPLRALATGVAYSRVHTGVHYPGDVVVGSLIGATVGSVVSRLARYLPR